MCIFAVQYAPLEHMGAKGKLDICLDEDMTNTRH